MKKLLFIGACLVALASQPVMAQVGGQDIVVVKVAENYNYVRFRIARPGSKPEEREFKGKSLDALGGTAEATRQLLAELGQQGYALTASYGGGDRFGNMNTLVFTKRP